MCVPGLFVQTHQLRVEGARILCSSLIQADELSSLRLPWNDLGDAGCNIMANAVQVLKHMCSAKQTLLNAVLVGRCCLPHD